MIQPNATLEAGEKALSESIIIGGMLGVIERLSVVLYTVAIYLLKSDLGGIEIT